MWVQAGDMWDTGRWRGVQAGDMWVQAGDMWVQAGDMWDTGRMHINNLLIECLIN